MAYGYVWPPNAAKNPIYPVVEQLALVTRVARLGRKIMIPSFPRKMEKMGPVPRHSGHFLLTCDNFADTIEIVSSFSRYLFPIDSSDASSCTRWSLSIGWQQLTKPL
jgi:hypothetical protein